MAAMVITVVENPIINRVLFEGNSSIKEDKLRDEVTVRPRGIFTRAKAQADVGRIVELYRRAGRISADVTPQIVELPQKRVDLIFKIDEGPKSGVLRVNFLGNHGFSDNDLRDVVVTEQSHWYKFFSSQRQLRSRPAGVRRAAAANTTATAATTTSASLQQWPNCRPTRTAS